MGLTTIRDFCYPSLWLLNVDDYFSTDVSELGIHGGYHRHADMEIGHGLHICHNTEAWLHVHYIWKGLSYNTFMEDVNVWGEYQVYAGR